MATNLSESIPHASTKPDMTSRVGWTASEISMRQPVDSGAALILAQIKRHALRLAQTHHGDWTFIVQDGKYTYWRSSDTGQILSVCVPCKALQIKRVMCECGKPATEYVGGVFGCGGCDRIPF